MMDDCKRYAILVGSRTNQNVWKFLFTGTSIGIEVNVPTHAPALPLEDLVRLLEAHGVECSANQLEYMTTLSPDLVMENSRTLTLMLYQLGGSYPSLGEDWITLPELLRRIPKNKNRISLLKVMQYLSYDPSDEYHAFEVDLKEGVFTRKL